jgi:hypothetical protein
MMYETPETLPVSVLAAVTSTGTPPPMSALAETVAVSVLAAVIVTAAGGTLSRSALADT